jgi:phosphoglucomutase
MYDTWLSHVSAADKILLQQLSPEERSDAFYTSLSFGTGGIRGKVGLGPNRMSVYLVRKIMSGYGQFLQAAGKQTVAIFNDNRQFGRVFVQEAVNVLATFGITSYCYDELRPTPLLSFAIRYLKLDAGINFTASHNPKEYQGIKLYDETGCQYIPSQIESLLPLIEQASYFDNFQAAIYQNVPAAVEVAYLKMIASLRIQDVPMISTVFTPLHGASSTLITKIVPSVITVKEQMVVDPYFTTVDYPNPEFESAYEYAYNTAKQVGAKLVIASDPDGDRIGCSVLHHGAYRFLTGNEIAVLILDYVTRDRDVSGGVIFKSIVTSRLGDAIAKQRGLTVVDTLTGFKWMGYQMNHNKLPFVMAYEESNGVIVSDTVRDKDAFQGIVLLMEAASVYSLRNKTLVDRLDELTQEFGRYDNETLNFTLEGASGMIQINQLMAFFRTGDIEGLDDRYDYLNDALNQDNVIALTIGPSRIMIRPSGTEPKLKMYVETFNDQEIFNRHVTMMKMIVKEQTS